MRGMRRFLMAHRHADTECGVAFAAWKGFDSPLRHRPAVASCAFGGHLVQWLVSAADETAARALLPSWLAQRTEVTEVRPVTIP